jgi:hypothetical protein
VSDAALLWRGITSPKMEMTPDTGNGGFHTATHREIPPGGMVFPDLSKEDTMIFNTARNWYEAYSKKEREMLDREMDLHARIHDLRHSLNCAEQESLENALQDVRCSDFTLTQYRKEQILELWEKKIGADD